MSTRGFTLGSIGPFPGQLYIVNLDDGTFRRVTTEPLTSSLGPGSWSPDGRSLTLSREVVGQLDVFLLDLTDSTERQITHAPESEYSAEFSHDGQWVAFHAETDSSSQIVVARMDGTDRRVVTQGPGFRYTPHWSPDDAWLLYSASGPDGTGYNLRAVRVSDGRKMDILASAAEETEGVWLRPEAR
jgi:Tol biopolymer transport system component